MLTRPPDLPRQSRLGWHPAVDLKGGRVRHVRDLISRISRMAMAQTHPSYLLIAFVAFIGSSYLDNVRGPLLPTIERSTGFDHLQASWFLSLGNLGALIGIAAFTLYLYKIRLRRLTLGGWVFGFIVCLCSLVTSGWSIFPLAIALGLIIAAVQSIANVLIIKGSRVEDRSRNLCGLHLMFGVGSACAPLVSAEVSSRVFSWQTGISLAGIVFAVTAALTYFYFPEDEANASETKHESLNLDGAKIAASVVFMVYVAAQVLSAQWMITYLHEGRGFTAGVAGRYLAGYFGVVTLSRLGFFIFLKDQHEKFAMNLSIGLSCLFLVIAHSWPGALVLAGIQAPFYPIYLGRMSKRFKETSSRVTLLLLLSAQAGLMIAHSVLGDLADKIGVANAYWLPAALMLAAIIGFNLLELQAGSTVGRKDLKYA